MKLFKRQALGIKVEATQGTPVVPATATDYVKVIDDISIDPVPEVIQRDVRRASLDNITHLVGGRYTKVKFKVEATGSGTRGTKTIAGYAGVDAALEACGFVSVAVGATSITYSPTSVPASGSFFGPGKSVTLEVYKDGHKHIVAGSLGTVKITGGAGEIPMFEFEFQGVYADPTDVAVPTPTFAIPTPPLLMSGTVTVQGLAAILSKLEVDVANKITRRLDAASATSIKGFVITDRDPKGSIQIEAESVATHAFHNRLMVATEASVSFAWGSTSGNIITMTMPNSQYNDVQYQNREDLLDFSIPLQFNQNSGDDWISIVVT